MPTAAVGSTTCCRPRKRSTKTRLRRRKPLGTIAGRPCACDELCGSRPLSAVTVSPRVATTTTRVANGGRTTALADFHWR